MSWGLRQAFLVTHGSFQFFFILNYLVQPFQQELGKEGPITFDKGLQRLRPQQLFQPSRALTCSDLS